MKTVFEKTAREELIRRINQLDESSKREWGQMNVFQMMRHIILWNEMILQNKAYKRVFIGRLLGRVFLKKEVGNDSPMRRNNPTIPELKIKEWNEDIQSEKARWIALVEKYAAYDHPDNSFTHPFFGKMTRGQIGYHAYKHNDHHLRQFNC